MINACISNLGKTRALHPADGFEGMRSWPAFTPKIRYAPPTVLGFLICPFAPHGEDALLTAANSANAAIAVSRVNS
jgi:hypothetical protein